MTRTPAVMIRLYEAGLSIREVGELVGMSYSGTRHRLFKVYGVTPRTRGNSLCRGMHHSEMARTAFLYEHGKLTQNEIAEILGLNQSTVWRRLKVHGANIRSRGESTRLRWERRPRGEPLDLSFLEAA